MGEVGFKVKTERFFGGAFLSMKSMLMKRYVPSLDSCFSGLLHIEFSRLSTDRYTVIHLICLSHYLLSEVLITSCSRGFRSGLHLLLA